LSSLDKVWEMWYNVDRSEEHLDEGASEMATRKTKVEAKKVWDMFHSSFPHLHFTIEFSGDQIHILQTLKCRVCGSEIKTHAVGQHDGVCNACKVKRNHKTASSAKTKNARQHATWEAQAESVSLHGEEF